MEKRKLNNITLKILSLGIAFIAWILIINIDDPVRTKKFYKIPVNIQNESVITSLNKVYEVIEGDYINITVKGKRSIVDNLRATDFKATADLSNLSSVNAVPIKASFIKDTSGVEIIEGINNTLRITLEDVAESQFKVGYNLNGSIADGYYISEVKLRPNLIRVSGGETIISKLNQVKIEIDISGISDNFVVRAIPKAYDQYGNELDSTKLKFSTSQIKATVNVLETKNIPINVVVQGNPINGYTYSDIIFEPKEVLVAGNEDILDSVKSITIPVDISGIYNNFEEEISLVDYLPDGIIVADENSTIVVNIPIEKMQTKDIALTSSSISIENLDENLEYRFLDSSSILVRVMADGDILNNITSNDLNAYIDLNGLQEGVHTTAIKFNVNSDINIMSQDLSVKVRLVNKNFTPDTQEPDNNIIDKPDDTDNKPNDETDTDDKSDNNILDNNETNKPNNKPNNKPSDKPNDKPNDNIQDDNNNTDNIQDDINNDNNSDDNNIADDNVNDTNDEADIDTDENNKSEEDENSSDLSKDDEQNNEDNEQNNEDNQQNNENNQQNIN